MDSHPTSPPAADLERLARLQAFTAALSEAATTVQVADAILAHMAAVFESDGGAVYQLGQDATKFVCFRTIGYPEAAAALMRQAATDPRTPLSDATAYRRPVLLGSRAERIAKYPEVYEKLARVPSAFSGEAAAVLPLLVRGRAIGALALRFPTARTFAPEDLALLLTVGNLCAQALDRARLHDIVAREQELLGTIFERIPVMLTVYHPDTRVLRLNPAFERITRWTAKGGSLMADCYPDPAYREEIAAFMRSSRDGWMDIRMRTRDGRDIETTWANVRLSDGTQVGIGLDISDRKRQEEALKAADRRKDEFLATLAHELRNPLAPLLNGLELMRLRRDEQAAVEDIRVMMERQVGQMVRLIDDLLDVSRITCGRLQLKPERTDLSAVVGAAVESTRPLSDAAGHRLTVELPPQPVQLFADPIRLAQVLGNLLTNATKYTDSGGEIRLSAERSEGWVTVSIKDTGIGLAAEHLTKVFQMFSQVAPALDRSRGGLGIGLSLVKGLVEMHGGEVEARSEGVGKGCEFIVRLPVIPTTTAEPPPRDAADPDAGGETTETAPYYILVADDNRDAADSLAMVLRLQGHEVHVAHDGQDALDLANEFHPDLIFLDIGMPRMNGYDCCRRIREESWGRQVLIAAVTGWGQEGDKRQAKEAGFDHHLTKPVSHSELERMLAEVRREG